MTSFSGSSPPTFTSLQSAGVQALVRRLTHQLGVALRGDAPPPAPVPGSEEDLPLPPWMVEMPFLSPLLVAYDARIAQLEAAHVELEQRATEHAENSRALATENDQLRAQLRDALAAAMSAASKRHESESEAMGARAGNGGGAENDEARKALLVEMEDRLALLASENSMLRQRAETDARMLEGAQAEIDGSHAERRRAVDEATHASRVANEARTALAFATQRADVAEAELSARSTQLEDHHFELLASREEAAHLHGMAHANELRIAEAQRALALAQETSAAREAEARTLATEANGAAEAMAVELADAQEAAAAHYQMGGLLRSELEGLEAHANELAADLEGAREELVARAARAEADSAERTRALDELGAALADAEAERARAEAAGAGTARELRALRAILEAERGRASEAAQATNAEAAARVLAARTELEASDRAIAELRAQLELRKGGQSSAAEARAAAEARRLAVEEGVLVGTLREALAAAGRRRDEADAEAAAAMRRQRRLELELETERGRSRSAVADAVRELDSWQRKAAAAERARDEEAAKLGALQLSLADPSGPTQRHVATLEASIRQQELQLQSAILGGGSAESEVRELRALASSQAELAERYANEARREQRRARDALDMLSADNDQLRVALSRPRSGAHRDELLEAHASEVLRLREQLGQLEHREAELSQRARDAERRADMSSMDNTSALALIHRAQSLVA